MYAGSASISKLDTSGADVGRLSGIGGDGSAAFRSRQLDTGRSGVARNAGNRSLSQRRYDPQFIPALRDG